MPRRNDEHIARVQSWHQLRLVFMFFSNAQALSERPSDAVCLDSYRSLGLLTGLWTNFAHDLRF